MELKQLETVFLKWADHLGLGELDEFYDMMHEQIVILDEL